MANEDKSIGRLTVNGETFDVEQATPVERAEDSILYEVWVKRGDSNEQSQ